MSRKPRSHNYFWGIILILLGVLFLLQNLHYLDIGNMLFKYWPVILILFGSKMILDRRSLRNPGEAQFTSSDRATGSSGDHATSAETGPDTSYSNVLGDIRRNFDNRTIGQYHSSNVFGDINLDFSRADFQDPAYLKVKGVFGDMILYLPVNLYLEVQANYVAGSSQIMEQQESGILKNVSYQTPGTKGKKPRVRIEVSQVFGDIRILTR